MLFISGGKDGKGDGRRGNRGGKSSRGEERDIKERGEGFWARTPHRKQPRSATIVKSLGNFSPIILSGSVSRAAGGVKRLIPAHLGYIRRSQRRNPL